MTDEPGGEYRGGYPDVVCCNIAPQTCDIPSVFAPAWPRDARHSEKRIPSASTNLIMSTAAFSHTLHTSDVD